MNVKRIKRQCGVRGCKNLDTYAVSVTREMGNSIIICKECLEKTLEAVNNCKDEPVVKKKAGNGSPPPLFFEKAASDKPEKKQINKKGGGDLK